MKIIAIIPARSGSKGMPDKNILPLNGVPLIAYSIKAALDSGVFDTVMVSTDSEKYADIARSYGAEVPFLRSEETSGDAASSWSVVKEVIEKYETLGKQFDAFMLLQPTSPVRRGVHIQEACRLMEQKDANAIISVCENDAPLNCCNYLSEDQSMVGFVNDRRYEPRQMFGSVYRLNGAIYLYKVAAFKSQASIYEAKCYAYIMDRIHSVDVDDHVDFQLVEAIIQYLPAFQHYFE